MKVKIGIMARPMISESNKNIYGTYQEVSDTLLKFGGIPVGLFPPVLTYYHNKKYEECNQLTTEEIEDIHEMVDMCDGILLQGGDDFYPYDVEVVKYAYSKDIPILGICLGMQTMGYAMNGKVGHVEHRSVHKNKKDYSHSIYIDPKSKLYQILKKEEIKVNSRHKDCVINTKLDIVATSEDGVIEGIEDKNKTFFMGVQWHPESMIRYDHTMNLLFEEFINSVKNNRK